MSSLRHWVWLSTRGPAPGMYAARILHHFGTPEGAYFAGREELLRLMKLVAARGGIVTAHTRSRSLPYYGHSQDFLDGLREFLDLGRESGARIHVSHIQSGYTVTPAHDGLIRSAVSETLKELDRARQAGVNVT